MIVNSLQTFANFWTGFDIVVILRQIYFAINDCSCWRHVMWTIQSTDIRVVTSFWEKWHHSKLLLNDSIIIMYAIIFV